MLQVVVGTMPGLWKLDLQGCCRKSVLQPQLCLEVVKIYVPARWICPAGCSGVSWRDTKKERIRFLDQQRLVL